mmetsp:Transcript_32734/g.52228  ORF Transcript_32734/g.52228 Transcript_32734/m.52228 type:complete len:182 (+) Transcript_32734:41-586(+)
MPFAMIARIILCFLMLESDAQAHSTHLGWRREQGIVLKRGRESSEALASLMFAHSPATAIHSAYVTRQGPSTLVSSPNTQAAAPRAGSTAMQLFGLGFPELAVISIAALLIIGPDKIKPMIYDLGKSSSELKEVTEAFSEGMKEREEFTKAGLADGGEKAKAASGTVVDAKGDEDENKQKT